MEYLFNLDEGLSTQKVEICSITLYCSFRNHSQMLSHLLDVWSCLQISVIDKFQVFLVAGGFQGRQNQRDTEEKQALKALKTKVARNFVLYEFYHPSDFYKCSSSSIFLGGYDGSYVSSTETLVEGTLAWSFQEPLPSGRTGLRSISLIDTVIIVGKNSA